ncbi:hypothetical protein [Roseofilum casamattae]|uniref:Uncharacterized protein n=1 Tax=Roseofilum casamattae BLCC-M143 TaxID=3022442 RepID=A0ABT7C4N4_9CYAN|nr:hypothetical protein [Roseofilum casamattae]MDJ1185871.1 hypothetical protein [Roseofilum casamattae BLCC-M143]
MTKTDTTRYFCAAVQIDPKFRNYVLEEILYQEYRAISIPAGVNLLAVISHCFESRNREIARNAIVSILFMSAMVTAYGNIYYHTDIILSLFISLFQSFFSYYLLFAYLVVIVEVCFARYLVIAKYLLRHNFDPDRISLSFENQYRIKHRLSGMLNEEECNVIVYSGFRPFIGSGQTLNTWSFTLDISKPKTEMTISKNIQDFSVEDLYRDVENGIKKLNLPGVSVRDKVFVNGWDIQDDELFLPDKSCRPVASIPTDIMKEFTSEESERSRYYKQIRIMSWQGDIVLSIFLRFVKLRQHLFIEASYCLLSPLKPEYYAVDMMPLSFHWWELLRVIQKAFRKTLTLFPFAIFQLVWELCRPIFPWNRRRAARRLINTNRLFDYGARTNIREKAASNRYGHYFQRLDKEMYFKVVERQIFDSTREFLDAHNIDTSELQQRQEILVNNGIIAGNVEAENMAVGLGANVMKIANNFQNNVQAVTQKLKE